MNLPPRPYCHRIVDVIVGAARRAIIEGRVHTNPVGYPLQTRNECTAFGNVLLLMAAEAGAVLGDPPVPVTASDYRYRFTEFTWVVAYKALYEFGLACAAVGEGNPLFVDLRAFAAHLAHHIVHDSAEYRDARLPEEKPA